LSRLDAGEREAIALAEDVAADLVILDERKARQVALERGLSITGLLGLLVDAAERGLVELREVLGRLRQTSFRVDPKLLASLLDHELAPKAGATVRRVRMGANAASLAKRCSVASASQRRCAEKTERRPRPNEYSHVPSFGLQGGGRAWA
jgi:hypothetical protein